MLKLSRLISDGAVLRCNHPVHIWGWDHPGRQVTVRLLNEKGTCMEETGTKTDPSGKFSLLLGAQPAGGPYRLQVINDAGETAEAGDILFGTVWFVSGQSNIDVNMERCFDSYPLVVRDCRDDLLRTFRIDVHADYHGPVQDVLSGRWERADRNHILAFSATGYFFARAMRELEHGIPVGFIQASLGGSRITSWMSKEMLSGDAAYRELLEEADRYADDNFMEKTVRYNETEPEKWKRELFREDRGCQQGWEKQDFSEKAPLLEIPCFFRDTALKDFTGSVWLSRTFEVPQEMAGKSAALWLGTMVDSDETFLNGVKVGETGYQYPPRKYQVPEGVLRRGANRVTVRLCVENGQGRITPGKGYFLFNDQGVVNLAGTWRYRIGKRMETHIPPTDFVNWKATGLFNGMAAPCTQYSVDGIVWYQGEANTHEPYDYFDLSRRYIEGYRKLWKEELPYVFVQLPNFDVDLDNETQWPDLREKQRRILTMEKTGMAASMDLGEDNDLHPHGKKEIGRRLALAADHLAFGGTGEYTGPVPERAVQIRSGMEGCLVRLTLSHADGLYQDSADRGTELRDFSILDKKSRDWPCRAEIDGNEILIECPDLHTDATALSFAHSNVMLGASVYNSSRLPMAPFVMKVEVI